MSEAVRTFTAQRHLTGAIWDQRAWDADHDRVLTQMVVAGFSCGVMAKKLGRSKNSVIGRCRRLHLQLAHRPTVRQPKPGAHHSATEAMDGPSLASPVPPPPASPPKDQRPEHSPPAVSPRPLPPAAFPAFRTCQYPRGDRPHWDFCGEPVAPGRPYCATHVCICWVSPPRKAAA